MDLLCAKLGSTDSRIERGLMFSEFAMPCIIKIAERPSIFERRASRLTTDRGFVGAIGVERRIQIDEVYRLRINPPQDMQVIAFKNGSVFDIHHICCIQNKFYENPYLDLPAPVLYPPTTMGRWQKRNGTLIYGMERYVINPINFQVLLMMNRGELL